MLAAGAETIGAGEGALLVGMQKAFSGLWGDGGGVIGAEAMDGGGTTNTTGSLGAMTGSTSSTLGGHATGSSAMGTANGNKRTRTREDTHTHAHPQKPQEKK